MTKTRLEEKPTNFEDGPMCVYKGVSVWVCACVRVHVRGRLHLRACPCAWASAPACVSVYVSMCVGVCLYLCVLVYKSVYVYCVWVSVYTPVRVSVCTYVYVPLCVCTCLCVLVCILCMCVCVYVCKYSRARPPGGNAEGVPTTLLIYSVSPLSGRSTSEAHPQVPVVLTPWGRQYVLELVSSQVRTKLREDSGTTLGIINLFSGT